MSRHMPDALGKFFFIKLIWMPIIQETWKIGVRILESLSMSIMYLLMKSVIVAVKGTLFYYGR